ncbi:hypothetical protein BT63DRAFT_411679 [Microthyrium microscopicum]|uniref:Uncharacterized protein n=1 Tax=Microthyrium microscopicum TaxID=703497 RepID=A0A6A6UL59_9PEZI|nr:hypothetical protein BT63DRAFT_411679 [Microthyrium microscopicum]
MFYKDLDDLKVTTAAASQHAIVISTTHRLHAAPAQALLRDLAQGKATTSQEVGYIHSSGISILADQHISGKWVKPKRIFDNDKGDIYGYEQERDAVHPYPLRSVQMGVVDTGLELSVNILVIMSPNVFGIGTRLFNRVSQQIPAYIQPVLKHGRDVVVGDGSGVRN